MDLTLLDTDIQSEILKGRNSVIRTNADAYLKAHARFAISSMSHFEVVRGIRFKQARSQLQDFEALCRGALLLTVSDSVLDRAANLWVTGRTGGHPHRDADLIIAATALEHGRTLVTGNTSHFRWITDLKLADWRMP